MHEARYRTIRHNPRSLHTVSKATAYSIWENSGKPEGRDEPLWQIAVAEEKYGEPPATDIEAVLTVIERRGKHHRAIEARAKKVFDFRQAVLRRADLCGAHLERAHLRWAHLECANLSGAYLEGANLRNAHLENAGRSKCRPGLASGLATWT